MKTPKGFLATMVVLTFLVGCTANPDTQAVPNTESEIVLSPVPEQLSSRHQPWTERWTTVRSTICEAALTAPC